MAICNQCLPKNVALAELTYKVAKLGSRRPNRTSVLLVGVKLMGLCGPENLKHPKTNMFKVATVFTPANFLSKSDPTVILFWFIELATDAIIHGVVKIRALFVRGKCSFCGPTMQRSVFQHPESSDMSKYCKVRSALRGLPFFCQH
jgi:hypothetical protein